MLAHLTKIICNNLNQDLENINTYTESYQNPSICSKDIGENEILASTIVQNFLVNKRN